MLRVGVPALRERGSDLPLLIDHFRRAFGPNLGVAPDDLARLVRHSWPGNVRELRNVMERACLLARGSTINIEGALTGDVDGRAGIRTDLPFKEAKHQWVEAFEREYIEGLLSHHKTNLSAAAREAQIDRKHLRELMHKYNFELGHRSVRDDRDDDAS